MLGEDHGLFKPSEIPEILFADGYGQPIDMEHEQAKKIKLPYPRGSSAIYYSNAAPDKEFSIFNFRSLKQPHRNAPRQLHLVTT